VKKGRRRTSYNRLVDALRADPFSRRVAEVIPIRKEQ
jgi:hypothetical protein